MIRKPGKDDFRENQAIAAMRETRTIAVEGSKGIQKGLSRLYLMWFGGMMAFGLLTSLVSALGGVGMVILGVVGYFWWQGRAAKQRNTALLMAEAAGAVRGFGAGAAPYAQYDAAAHLAPQPPAMRGGGAAGIGGTALLDIQAVAQQAFVLAMAGLMLIFVLARMGDDMGVLANALGIALIALAVLVGARVVGDRKAIAWDAQGVRVWHLLGDGQMQWSDVVDISVVKAPRFDLGVYFRSGSSRNIVLTAPINRVGGPNVMLVPVRMMALDDQALVALVRQLGEARAAMTGTVPPPQQHGLPFAAAAPNVFAAARPPVFAPPPAHAAPDPVAEDAPHESFDPDAIMARYLRERADLAAQQERERSAIHAHQDAVRAAHPAPARGGGFGRKGL